MEWRRYLGILRRRWSVLAIVLIVAAAGSGYLYRKEHRTIGYQASVTVYVADVSSPSLIAAPSSTLETAGQLLAGETAANFFADDILDVAQSGSMDSYISRRLRLSGIKVTSLGGTIGGTRRDRTVSLTVSNSNPQIALEAARVLGQGVSTDRAQFIGASMARRTYVSVISQPSVAPTSSSRLLLSAALRMILGAAVAVGLALLWEAYDPTVRDELDVERVLGAPVLAVQ